MWAQCRKHTRMIDQLYVLSHGHFLVIHYICNNHLLWMDLGKVKLLIKNEHWKIYIIVINIFDHFIYIEYFSNYLKLNIQWTQKYQFITHDIRKVQESYTWSNIAYYPQKKEFYVRVFTWCCVEIFDFTKSLFSCNP